MTEEQDQITDGQYVDFNAYEASASWRATLSTGENALVDQGLLVEGESHATRVLITGIDGKKHKADVVPFYRRGATLHIPADTNDRVVHGRVTSLPKKLH